MTARGVVVRTRSLLLGTAAGSAALTGLAIGIGVVLLACAVDLAVPLPRSIREIVRPLSFVTAGIGVAAVAWRARHAASLDRVALFIEERVPALRFALVTAFEAAGNERAAPLEAFVRRIDLRPALAAPLRSAVLRPGLAAGVALLALLAVPLSVRARVLAPRAGDMFTALRSRASVANRLEDITVRITPPAYAHRAATSSDNPSSVAALVGSRLELSGRGASLISDQIVATIGNGAAAVATVGDSWALTISMPHEPSIVRLGDRAFSRLLSLEPEIDRAPEVTLVQPTRDTTLPRASGVLVLDATAGDDIGLGSAAFEFHHTSGSGERFDTRHWLAGAVSPSGDPSARLLLRVRLDTMHLEPGDVLHLRAIAIDENNVTGPDSGFSETRTFRVYDPKSRDTLRIAAALATPFDTAEAPDPATRRFYPRGVIPLEAVDPQRIRLKGTDPVAVRPREHRLPLAEAQRTLLARLDAALSLLPARAAAAADTLAVLRIDALTLVPTAAPPLAQAIDALRSGRDARSAIAAVRQRLVRASNASSGLSLWRGIP